MNFNFPRLLRVVNKVGLDFIEVASSAKKLVNSLSWLCPIILKVLSNAG